MAFALFAAAVLANTPALGPTEADLERFKALFTQGEKLYGQGEYGGAIWSFKQADAIHVTPEVAFDLAKCFEKLNDAAYATYYYRLYLRRAPQAADALEVAEKIGSALAAGEAEGWGLIEVEGFGAKDIRLNGKLYPEFPVAAFLPPGDYEVTATFPSGVQKQLVQVKTGKTTTVQFEPLPPPLVQAGEDMPAWASRGGPERTGRDKARTASMVVLGASLAALAAGTVFGALAASDADRLRSDRQNLTVGDAQKLADSANGRGTAANLLWLAGGVGAVGGGVLFAFTLPEPGQNGGGGQ